MGHFFLQRVCCTALPAVFVVAVTGCWALQQHAAQLPRRPVTGQQSSPAHPPPSTQRATAAAAAGTNTKEPFFSRLVTTTRSSTSRLYCEAATAAQHQHEQDDRDESAHDSTSTTTIKSSTSSSSFPLDPSVYQRMDLPDRANTDSHVIYGALLADNLVESYHAYRNIHDNTVVVAVVQLGRGVDGHPGVVHGGILALLMDDVLGFGYEALGDVPMAVTANLNINYLQAVPAGARVLVQAQLQQREGRKLYWKVRVVSARDESEIYCEATSLFIIPRDAYYEKSSNETAGTRTG